MLIRPEWVLTAAHCVQSAGFTYSTIVIGRGDLSSGGETRQVRDVKRTKDNYTYCPILTL